MRSVSLVAASATLAVLTTLLVPKGANAQANLVFTGGSGTPLTLSLTAPITYNITLARPSGVAPYFVFDGVSNNLNFVNNSATATATLTFTVNGGTPLTIGRILSGTFTSNDVTISGGGTSVSSFPNLVLGDVVVLTAGTVTTTTNVAAAAPIRGSFTTFISDGNGFRASSNGVAGATASAAPEPGSIAFALIAGLPALGIVARRRNKRHSFRGVG